MSQVIDWCIEGRKKDGENIPAEEWETVNEYCLGAFGTDPLLYLSYGEYVDCSTATFRASDNIQRGLVKYTARHPEVRFDVTFRYETEDAPDKWRIENGRCFRRYGHIEYSEETEERVG